MLKDSLDALRGMLNNEFPEIDTIYINNTPETFNRPCFLVQLVKHSSDNLNRMKYRQWITWEIVYFAPIDDFDIPDRLKQFGISDTLKNKLIEGINITGPSGKVYYIYDCEGEPRDNEVYITVRLGADFSRPEKEYDLMQDVEHNIGVEYEHKYLLIKDVHQVMTIDEMESRPLTDFAPFEPVL